MTRNISLYHSQTFVVCPVQHSRVFCRILAQGFNCTDLSQNNTYNQRSVSTLALESFFSDLSQVTHTTSGIPMAANVPRYLARMSQLNKIKDDPTK